MRRPIIISDVASLTAEVQPTQSQVDLFILFALRILTSFEFSNFVFNLNQVILYRYVLLRNCSVFR